MPAQTQIPSVTVLKDNIILPNRLYKLYFKDNKVYGAWIAGQFHSFDLSFEVIHQYVSLFIVLFSIGFLESFLNAEGIYSIIIWVVGIAIYWLYLVKIYMYIYFFTKGIFSERISKINQVIESRIKKTNEALQNPEKFLKLNKHNFILERETEIENIEINDNRFWPMYPEPHTGQFILKQTNGKKIRFLIKDISPTELDKILENQANYTQIKKV
jgi:hypothetical protein